MNAKEFTDSVQETLSDYWLWDFVRESPRSLIVSREGGYVYKITVNVMRTPDDMLSGAPTMEGNSS